MASIPANDLKTRGVTAIENTLVDSSEAIVSVRGRDKYVVMSLEHYTHLRSCELEAALSEARRDITDGRYICEDPASHLLRIEAME